MPDSPANWAFFASRSFFEICTESVVVEKNPMDRTVKTTRKSMAIIDVIPRRRRRPARELGDLRPRNIGKISNNLPLQATTSSHGGAYEASLSVGRRTTGAPITA